MPVVIAPANVPRVQRVPAGNSVKHSYHNIYNTSAFKHVKRALSAYLATTAAGRQLIDMSSWHIKKAGGLEINEAGDIEAAKDKSHHSTAVAKVAQVCMTSCQQQLLRVCQAGHPAPCFSSVEAHRCAGSLLFP
jgi:hypothetical protein